MNTIGDRLHLFISHMNISVRSFEIKVGLSNGLIGKVIGKNADIGAEKVSKILYAYPKLNSEWLLMGIEPMLKNEYPLTDKMNIHLNIHSKKNEHAIQDNLDSTHKPVPYITGNHDIMSDVGGIPYYESLPVSAGDIFSFLSQAKPASFVNLPQIADCTAVLPVYGSSMKGIIEPGDLIAIKEVKTRDEFDPAVPYMVITEEHRMVKYLRVDDTDQSVIWAESTNHSKIRLTADNIKMVYAIKCVIRFF